MISDQPVALMSERRTALIGGALVAVGPVSMALYTPAMPTLVQVFDTSPPVIKMTLTTYFAGFALAQLVCGPLSDAFGRKRISLVFMAIYFVASLAAFFAPNVQWMLAARALQGVGAAAGIATGRAIVRDQYTGQTSARIMNGIAMTLAVGPAVAPTIGGTLLSLLGWQAIFGFMVLLVLPIAAMIHFLMRETNRAPDRSAIMPGPLLRTYAALLVDARFMRPATVMALSISLFYTMATILPFVLIDEVGLTPSQFGYAMVLQSGSFILGTVVTSRLLQRYDAAKLVPVGVLAFGIALVIPHMSTQAIAPFARRAGAAAAMMGFLQMAGGLTGSLLAAALNDPLLALSLVVPAMPILGLLAFWLLQSKADQSENASM